MTEDSSFPGTTFSSAASFDRLPFELKLRILSWTDLGARGSYRPEHGLMYIDNGPILLDQETERANHGPGEHDRSLKLDLFLVSSGMYRAAFDVLYRESHFVLAPAYQNTLNFVRQLPPAGLRMIQRLRLRASVGDAELILNNTWARSQAKRWIEVADILQQSCDVRRLQLKVDLTIVNVFCGEDNVSEKRRRAAYQYYMFITSTLSRIRGLKSITFDLIWARGLASWMKREVLGDSCQTEAGTPRTNSTRDDGTGNLGDMPSWHQDERSIRSFNFHHG